MLLDSSSEESSSWSWAGGGAGPGGGAAFFAGAAGLGLDDNPDGAAGALAKRPCLSLGREMVAICGEQGSPGLCSRPFKEQGGVLVLQGQGRRRVISPLLKIKDCAYVLVKKCNRLLSIARFPEGNLAIQ